MHDSCGNVKGLSFVLQLATVPATTCAGRYSLSKYIPLTIIWNNIWVVKPEYSFILDYVTYRAVQAKAMRVSKIYTQT